MSIIQFLLLRSQKILEIYTPSVNDILFINSLLSLDLRDFTSVFYLAILLSNHVKINTEQKKKKKWKNYRTQKTTEKNIQFFFVFCYYCIHMYEYHYPSHKFHIARRSREKKNWVNCE